MFQSKIPRSSRGVRHVRKFRFYTDASRDTRRSRTLNMHLPHIIVERAIHRGLVMDGRSFGQTQ